jgi:hypothetical protein
VGGLLRLPLSLLNTPASHPAKDEVINKMSTCKGWQAHKHSPTRFPTPACQVKVLHSPQALGFAVSAPLFLQ